MPKKQKILIGKLMPVHVGSTVQPHFLYEGEPVAEGQSIRFQAGNDTVYSGEVDEVTTSGKEVLLTFKGPITH